MSAYKPDDVDSAIHNLDDLLSVICSLQFDQSEAQRDTRIDSLLWIARDISEGIIAAKSEQSAKKMREAQND